MRRPFFTQGDKSLEQAVAGVRVQFRKDPREVLEGISRPEGYECWQGADRVYGQPGSQGSGVANTISQGQASG